MLQRLSATALATFLLAVAVSGQTPPPMKHSAPGTPGDPVWQGSLHMSDGRTFVTDGALAVDAAFAKPAALPAREIPGKVLEGYIKAPHKDECGFSDLTLALSGKTYNSPTGIALNSTYINFLRRVAPRGSRFRLTDGMHPVVVVAEGTAIAVLMPVKN
jgi:hypothetical protein